MWQTTNVTLTKAKEILSDIGEERGDRFKISAILDVSRYILSVFYIIRSIHRQVVLTSALRICILGNYH